ncbi:hypothetical protein SLA2020_451040 [Shorea laevis]
MMIIALAHLNPTEHGVGYTLAFNGTCMDSNPQPRTRKVMFRSATTIKAPSQGTNNLLQFDLAKSRLASDQLQAIIVPSNRLRQLQL